MLTSEARLATGRASESNGVDGGWALRLERPRDALEAGIFGGVQVHQADLFTAPFDVRSGARGTTRTLTVGGEVDIAVGDRLAAALGDAIGAVPETVVVDLAGITFFDTTGVHCLLDAQRHAAARGVRLVIIAPPDPVLRILTLCGVRAELPVVAGDGSARPRNRPAVARRGAGPVAPGPPRPRR